jgi:hypothetical protein
VVDRLHRPLQPEIGLVESLFRRTDEPDIPGFEGLARFPKLKAGRRADDVQEPPVVALGLLDHRSGARLDPIGLRGEGRPLSGEDAFDLELDLLEGRDRRQGRCP